MCSHTRSGELPAHKLSPRKINLDRRLVSPVFCRPTTREMRGPRGKSSWPFFKTPGQESSCETWRLASPPRSASRRPTNHVDGSTPLAREELTPQRLALARKPPIRYDTLPDARQSLPPPKATCQCVRPHASVIASNRSRKGNNVLCPPGTCAFLGAFLCAEVAAASAFQSRSRQVAGTILRPVRSRLSATLRTSNVVGFASQVIAFAADLYCHTSNR